MNEILDIPIEKEKIQHHQESGLTFENIAHLLDKSEKTPTEQQIKALFNPSKVVEVIDYTKDMELLFETKRDSSQSSESSDCSQPLKKAKTNSLLSSQTDPFEDNDTSFKTSTQVALDIVNDLFSPKPQEEKVNDFNPFKNPWKLEKAKTLVLNNPYHNQRITHQSIVPEENKVATKSSLKENFQRAWGSGIKSDGPVKKVNQKPQPEVKPFYNPWSSSVSHKINMPPAIEEKPFPLRKEPEVEMTNPFVNYKTAGQLLVDNEKKNWSKGLTKSNCPSALSQRKSNNPDRNNDDPLRKKFVCPVKSSSDAQIVSDKNDNDDELNSELLKGFDRQLLLRIKREVVSQSEKLSWDDIAGLNKAKEAIYESVIYPVKHPKLFQGLRRGSRAILLFGPPGNGKTLIGKAIASEVDATFLSISASSLTSKWIGESENLVRAMFAYAVVMQPSVIFFDEIDSLLMKRDGEGGGGESMVRLKTEFLVQLDGTNSLKDSDQVILIGATNRPDSIDEAVRRRFTKRILIPLPNDIARVQLMKNLLNKNNEVHSLTEDDFLELTRRTEGFSGSDLNNLAREAAHQQLRKMMKKNNHQINPDSVSAGHFTIKYFIKTAYHYRFRLQVLLTS